MPPALEGETGIVQALFPHIRLIGMMDARYLAEPILIRLAEDLGQREGREVTRVRHTEIERRTRLEHAGGLFQNRINMRNVFKDGVAESAGEVIGWKRRLRTVCFHKGFVRVVFLRFFHGEAPRVKPDIELVIEGQRGKVTITATHIVDRGWHGQVLIIGHVLPVQEPGRLRRWRHGDGERSGAGAQGEAVA